MIKSLDVINYLNERLEIDLMRPDISGLIVKSITGLEPPKATINVTKLATGDGSRYNSARLGDRNIVITLLFSNCVDETIEQLRLKVYKYFPIKRCLNLQVTTDSRKACITGYVESNDVKIFEQQEYTTISIKCPDPYFYSSNEIQTTVFSEIEPNFEFPFDEDIFEFAIVKNRSEENISYHGDAEIGMLITIHALGPATNISIFNTKTQEIMTIDTTKLATLTGAGITVGDDIIISTVRDEKHVTLLRNGLYTNILNCVGKNSCWFTLVNGDNLFAYAAATGNENLQFQIQNRIAYEGM